MTLRASHSIPVRMTVLAALMAGLSASALAAPGDVVISQVYGGGGNANATYKNDFVELFNRSNAAIDLTGWSVQYAATTGSSWSQTKLTGGVIQPGHYFLVQESSNAAVGADMPQADFVGTLTMAAGAGKVALVSNQTALTTAMPTSAALQDVVGYGSGTNFFEGTGPTGTLSATIAALRAGAGCTDTNNNATDFSTGTPIPRNTATPQNTQCSTGGGGTPVNQPIVLTCPASINGQAGTAFSGALLATDPDSIVNAAAITSGAQAGISLGFTPASSNGGNATAQLSADSTLVNGNYTVGVTFTNNGGQTANCSVKVVVGGTHTIPQIQGSGATSPVAGTVQTTTGVITKIFAGGFYIQDADGDQDPTTPDGIYVFGTPPNLPVGELVKVTGTVSEYTPAGAPRSFTEFGGTLTIADLGVGKTVPVTNIVLGADDLRRYEGMLVRFSGALTVNGNSYLGDRGELVLGNGRLETPSNKFRPGTPEIAALMASNERNTVILDDNIFVTPDHIPYLGQDGTVRAGDTVNDLVGVLDFGSTGGGGGWYKLQPNQAPSFSRTNPREATPTVTPGNVRVASANVLNFFTVFTDGTDVNGGSGLGCSLGSSVSKSNCRGADNMTEFVRQRDKIVAELKGMDADAVGLMEIQNNGDNTVAYLVNALNQAIGSTTYAYVPMPPATGTDAIRVAMIYKPAKLTLVGGAMSDNDSVNNRPPMAQTFKVNGNGAKFSLIVNHLKSKGSCPTSGAGEIDSGDGQSCWNATRVQQATRLNSYFIPAVVAAAGDPDVLAVGDFNSYGQEDPIAYLTSNGMVNELERFIRPSGVQPYSYVFDGNSGYLDHALATTSLNPQVAGVTEWHNNADEPDAIDYNIGDTADDPYVANAFRASDHDPVVVSLNLAPAYSDVTGSVKITVSAPVTNRITSKTTGSVTFTNTSGAAINGPFEAIFQGLPAGITLDNKSGDFGGAPYVMVPTTSLAAGASITVAATFSNPARTTVSFTPKLFNGTF